MRHESGPKAPPQNLTHQETLSLINKISRLTLPGVSRRIKLMPIDLLKHHREFFAIRPDAEDTRWTPVHADAGVIEELVLADNFDPIKKSGSRTRLARWKPGALMAQPVIHEFHEEVFIVEGEFIVGCNHLGDGGETFGSYTFACRPPQVWHGPFATRAGCVLFEIQYYQG